LTGRGTSEGIPRLDSEVRELEPDPEAPPESAVSRDPARSTAPAGWSSGPPGEHGHDPERDGEDQP
jgi:hypothetical protein